MDSISYTSDAQTRREQKKKFLQRATRSSLEIMEISLYLYLYYRGIYAEELFRSVRRFRKKVGNRGIHVENDHFVDLFKSVIVKECISPEVRDYVNQALKPAEELIQNGQLRGVHCVISTSDGVEIERLCFDIKDPKDLEGQTSSFFQHARSHEMEKYYQIFLKKIQGEEEIRNVYAESSYHFTRLLSTLALLRDLPEQHSWHLEYKAKGKEDYLKISDENGRSLVAVAPRNG